MPLYRLLPALLLCLWALTTWAEPGPQPAVDPGACVGQAAPPPAPAKTPPYDLARAPMPVEEEQYWRLLGYRLDAKRSRLLTPAGEAVSEPEVAFTRQPFDARSESLDAETWIALQGDGFRLDEVTCHFQQKGRPASRLEVRLFRFLVGQGKELAAVESLRAALGAAAPGQRIPPEILAKLQQMKAAQLRLPPGLEAKLTAAANVREALAAVDQAHEASARFWDAQTGLGLRLKAALPVVTGWTTAEKPAAYAGEAEARVGKLLNSDVQSLLAQYAPGAELMARFKGRDGKTRLPAVRILKLSQRPGDAGYGNAGAAYDPQSDSVTLNYWYVVRYAVGAAPEAERARLAKDFADPARLSAYLAQHPGVRRSFLQSCDQDLFHELIHAWQSRRTKLDVEMLRGNLPAMNPLEKEHEAFREESRYLHAKLMKAPAEAMKSPWLDSYLALLGSYDEFREGITRQYMSTFGGSLDAPTMEQIQKARRGLARRLGSRSAADWAQQALKLVGLGRGDEALREFRTDQDARSREFVQKQWPKMRGEGYPALLREFQRAGRLDKALLVARLPGAASAEQRQAIQGELERRMKDGPAAGRMPFMERMEAWPVLDQVYGGQFLPRELQTARERDYSDYARAAIAGRRQAKSAADKAGAATAMNWARGLLVNIQDATLRKTLARELDAEERRR